MNLDTVLGLGGMTLILIGFIAEELEKMNDQSPLYNLINLVGAGLLAWYAFTLASIPFLVLNIIWALVALWKLARERTPRREAVKKNGIHSNKRRN